MLPVVVGGTGLYLKALMQGIAEMPDIAPEIRNQSIADYESMFRLLRAYPGAAFALE